MELYEISINGKEFSFQVLKNFAEPCPVCRIPACGREDIVWYEDNHNKIAIVYDGGCLSLVIEEFLKQESNGIKLDTLPKFITDWIMSVGWTDSLDVEGHLLDIEDYLKALNLLKQAGLDKWMNQQEWIELECLAQQARVKGKQLRLLRG